MLLWMKATVEGMRSMIYTGAFWQDYRPGACLKGDEKQHYYANLLDFMTPIIKGLLFGSWDSKYVKPPSSVSVDMVICKEYPLEQYLRDAKIMSLYEGTNGIQSMDLMGRKMRINNGGPFVAFRREIEKFCQKNQNHSPGRR